MYVLLKNNNCSKNNNNNNRVYLHAADLQTYR